MNISELFRIMVQQDASDLFLSAGSVPRARVNGVVKEVTSDMITQKDMVEVSQLLLGDEKRRKSFAENLDIDFIHDEPTRERFRINIFMQRETPAIVARHVQRVIRNFEELNLPAELLRQFCDQSSGLVLLCGPAGSGKSTAIASMLEYINTHQQKHIVTIEDPIEFLFENKKSVINQRELGGDVHSYPAALKHVTQQSPDVIYIGNTRDLETMRAAISATELGCLVFTTFHTVNAVQTITRIINFFPPYLHEEVRMQLSLILKGIVSLRLVPRFDKPGRIPAYESLVVTPTIARLIREGNDKEIQQFIDEGELFGMQSFKKSLVTLVNQGITHEDDARRFADSKDEFNLELKGVKRYQK